MKAMYCQYCGSPLEDRCNCLRELAEYEEDLIEELESRPETQYGWIQQDLIDLHRMEQ